MAVYRTAAGLIGVAAMVSALTGCTTSSPGRAEPDQSVTSETSTAQSSAGQTSGSPSQGNLPSDGAPKVKNPLDASRFEQNPCLALTQEQLKELNVGPQGAQRATPSGQACEWNNDQTQGSAELSFLTKIGLGLSGAYAARKSGKYAYFIELPEIEGFPAIAASQLDDRSKGTCFVDVGVSDRLSFQLALDLSQANVGKKDPCEVAAQVAGMALKTMKAGG